MDELRSSIGEEKKSYKFDLETESGRIKALEFFKKWILPEFPTYFEQVLKKREEEETWHEKSICWDVFQIMADHPEGMDNLYHQEGVVVCTIPAPRGFWDAWMAIYCLENPKLFKNLTMCARLLLDYIKEIKLDPSNYKFFEPCHFNYLVKLSLGEEGRNYFFEDPRELLFLLRSYPMIEVACGNLSWDEWMKKPEAQEQLEKLHEKTYKDVEDFF